MVIVNYNFLFNFYFLLFMAQSDARFGYRADLNRESHELSHKFGFTCAPGMLLPVFADVASAGDTYYIEHDLNYLRTRELLAPAMVDVNVHYESFFVPFQLIYQPLADNLFGIFNSFSSFFDQDLQTQDLPLMNYLGVVNAIMQSHSADVKHSDAFRLADMFGTNADTFAFDSNHPSRFKWNPNFFPWQYLAYHAIFQYFYRLDDKTQFENWQFNFDKYYDASFPVNDVNDIMWTLHQRAWDFDYFTSSYRSPIVSNASMNNILRAGYYSPLFKDTSIGNTTQPIDKNGGQPSDNAGTRAFSSSDSASYDGSLEQARVSTAMIRQMFANEKIAMITGRARKTYDSQVLAHLGVKVPHDVKHDISLIGSDTYKLHIGEVTALASTEGAGLGDLAGKGWSQGKGRKLKFTCPCHGVIMTIFSVEPTKRYYGGYSRQNAISSIYDFALPEYDRLGNMPMFRYEAGENAGEGVVTATDIVAWKERYYYWKRRHDRVTLAFQNGTQAQGYNNFSSYMITSTPFGAYTATNNYTARPDLESRYYIDRNCMDPLMLNPYIGNWQKGTEGHETTENWNQHPWLCYARDPFIVDSYEKVTKVSWMSKDGEPIYNY